MTKAGLISAIEGLDLEELRQAWSKRFNEPPPAYRTRDLLLRAFAYRIESRLHSGLSLALRRRLDELAKAFEADDDFSPTAAPSIQPGSRITREWNGARHVVEATETGFRYQDTDYASLSMIARKITGAHRSGPAFFGLVGKAKHE